MSYRAYLGITLILLCAETSCFINPETSGFIDPASLFKAGAAAFGEQRHTEAVFLFEQLRMRAPDYSASFEADKLHGAALASLSRGEEAVLFWERAVQSRQMREPSGQSEFVDGVNQYITRALEVYHQTAKASPTSADIRASAGVLAMAAGRKKLAGKHLEAALGLQPVRPNAQLYLGMHYFNHDRPKESQRLLRSALELEPWHPKCIAGFQHLAAVSCRLEDLGACHDGYVSLFEASVALGNVEMARLGISSAAVVAIQRHGEARGLSEAKALGARGVASGVLQFPLQVPQHLHPGLRAKPWWDDTAKWPSVQLLERHANDIRAEVMRAYAETDRFAKFAELEAESKSLVNNGRWDEVNIIKNGIPQQHVIEVLPFTSKLVLSLPEAVSMVRGGSKISVMDPGTFVRSHSGLTNSRLRIHLGLSVPDDCVVVVNDEQPRKWIEGKCITFDDSFVHSVRHNGTAPRIVLIVDVWHPDLDTRAKQEASLSRHSDEHMIKRFQWSHEVQNMYKHL